MQKKFNRHVKRGEKGIQIIAPAPIREKQEIEKIDPVTKEPVIGDDGQPETGDRGDGHSKVPCDNGI